VCVCVCVCFFFSSFLGFEFSSFLKVKKTRRGRGVCLPAVFSFIVLFSGLCACFSFPRYLFSPFSPFLKVKKTRRGGGVFLPAFTIFFLLFSSLEASLLCACVCVCVLPSPVKSFLHFWRRRRQGQDVLFRRRGEAFGGFLNCREWNLTLSSELYKVRTLHLSTRLKLFFPPQSVFCLGCFVDVIRVYCSSMILS